MAKRPALQDVLRDLVLGEGDRSERLRTFVDSFSPGLFGRVEGFEKRLREEFARYEAGQAVSDPQAEAFVEMLYGYVKGIQERPASSTPSLFRSQFRKLSLRLLRNAVTEIELALLPQRAQAFELLGVRRSDSVEEIKTAFRNLARQHHPDRPGGDHRRMQELNRAYEIVMRIKGVA